MAIREKSKLKKKRGVNHSPFTEKRKERMIMAKRKNGKKDSKIMAKTFGFIIMMVFFYTVNLAGGCQKVATTASYDFDTNVIGIFR